LLVCDLDLEELVDQLMFGELVEELGLEELHRKFKV
jgi:hypothetical protein